MLAVDALLLVVLYKLGMLIEICKTEFRFQKWNPVLQPKFEYIFFHFRQGN